MLTERLAQLGARALLETVEQLQAGTATRTPQDHSAFTYAPMLNRDLSAMDWNRNAQQLHDQVRGLIPWPCATCQLGGNLLKVFLTQIGERTDAAAGTVLSAGKQGIEVACGDGVSLRILEVQGQGGKRMTAADYLNGHPLQV